MATKEQELNIARTRIAQGKGSPTDISNVEFADKQTQPAGDLIGTLDKEQPQSSIAGDFNNLRQTIEDITRAGVKKGGGIRETLSRFKEQVGITGALPPSVTQRVVAGETQGRVEDVGSLANKFLRTVDTLEQNRKTMQDSANSLLGNLASMGMLGSLSGEEINQVIQTGQLSPEALTKINQRAVQLQEQKREPKPATIAEKIAAAKEGLGIIGQEVIPLKDLIQKPVNSTMGGGTISGLGSDLWEFGLDFVLGGGKGASVKAPFIGEVIFAGNAGNFGNQVKLKTISGEEIWLSHLDTITANVGDQVNAETVIGTQGNSGKVLGSAGEELTSEQIEQEDRGTHVDITIKNPDGTFLSPSEVAAAIGISGVGAGITGDIEDLTAVQESQAGVLAKQLYGTIKTADQIENFLNPIKQRIADGENIDDIADSLRFAGQSPEFSGSIRLAAQQITSDWTDKKTQASFDKLDDVVGKGDIIATQDFLKKLALDDSGVEQARLVMGQERTLELIGEIGEDLKDFEDKGGDTNIFTGTVQQVIEKIGEEGDAELAKIANKVHVAIINYRRAISGAAFNALEAVEYREVFPSSKNTAELNSAKIEALQEVFQGDIDFFYGFKMGEDNYNEIFKQAPTGDTETIKVKIKATGETGEIPANEFDETIYDKI